MYRHFNIYEKDKFNALLSLVENEKFNKLGAWSLHSAFCFPYKEGLYYQCSENKGADQFRGYRESDLCLCFRISKKPVFSRQGSYNGVFYNL